MRVKPFSIVSRQIPVGRNGRFMLVTKERHSVSRRRTAFAVAVLVAAMAAHDARGEALVVEGPAVVVDSMTLQIWGKRIRLAGITTRDLERDGDETAKTYLKRLVADVRVRCETSGVHYQVETTGACFVGEVNIAASLVKAGHARPVAQQPLGRDSRRTDGRQRR